MSAVGSPRELNACGFAFGVERLLSVIPRETLPPIATTQALVIPVSTQDLPYALQIAHAARSFGMRTEVDVADHGVSAGLRLAARRQIRLALIVGEDERHRGVVTVRDLVTGEEQVSGIEALALCARDSQDKEQYL
jgi:histidyl-tRNA synthetase